MKINNEYVNTGKYAEGLYAENFFSEDLNSLGVKEGIFAKGVAGVEISKSEAVNSGEGYNKYGEYEDMDDKATQDGMNKGFDMETLKESLKNIMGEMDGSDYERLQQWGLAPADDDAEEVVTVYERIQIQLMTYCEDYNGTGLSINKNKMAKVLGSKSMAEAVSKSSDLTKFTDDTKEYMLKNGVEPTVENVYRAIHSAAKKEVTPVTDDAIKDAVVQKLEKEGFEISEKNVDNGMWLVSRGIELSSDNMTKLSELNQIDELKTGDEQTLATLSKNIAYSMYAGASSKNAYITDRYVNIDDVNEVIEAVNNTTDEQLLYIAGNNLPLNAANLVNAAKNVNTYNSSDNVGKPLQADNTSLKVVEFRQVIFEARIVMTQSSVFNLKRLGVDINYTEISEMTQEIVNEKNRLMEMMMRNAGFSVTAENKQMYGDVLDKMNSLKGLPQGVICKVHTQEISFTMNAVYTEGISLKNQYEAAMNAYETLGTEVRGDLGDSYSKAFGNVDSLISEIGMEVNSANQRAVRILGYNEMEISVENVESIREIATELDFLMDNMTPKTALYLIQNGINPLDDNIRMVNDELERINLEIGREDESMGKFLWKLEKKGQVTQKEKEDYIELYRILNMISKNDGNVIGRVINEGKELTLKNLYSAYKSKKAGDFDYSLSDEYAASYVKKSITSFMESAGDSPEIFDKVMTNGELLDISVEGMIDTAYEYSDEADAAYYEEQMSKYEDVMKLSKSQLEEVVRHIDSKSVSSIAAYMEMSGEGGLYKLLKDYEKTAGASENTIDSIVKNVVDNITDSTTDDTDLDSLKECYEKLEKAGEELVDSVKSEGDLSYKKLSGALMMKKTLRLMNSQAKNNSYFVPVDIGGEVTNIHLTINNDKAKNNVTVSMKNQVMGSISCVFTIKKMCVTGHVVSDNADTVATIERNMSLFTRTIETKGLVSGEIACYRSANEAAYKYDEDSDENVGVNTYYSVAKAFIAMVKNAV